MTQETINEAGEPRPVAEPGETGEQYERRVAAWQAAQDGAGDAPTDEDAGDAAPGDAGDTPADPEASPSADGESEGDVAPPSV